MHKMTRRKLLKSAAGMALAPFIPCSSYTSGEHIRLLPSQVSPVYTAAKSVSLSGLMTEVYPRLCKG